MKQFLVAVACGGCALVAGCASIGPRTIPRDRADYVTSISESWKRQMLQNLLKIRYADAPVFLDVTSVINAYALDSQLTVGGQVAHEGRGDQFATFGGNAGYSDHPTITYAPLSGEQFTRALLTPLPISAMVFLFQSGFPADAALRIATSEINGLDNAYGGQGNPRAGDPQFAELLKTMRAAQDAGIVDIRNGTAKDPETALLYVHAARDTASGLVDKMQKLLGLNPTAREYNMVYSSHQSNDTEIAVLTRSTLQVLTDFASYIDVPAADAAQGSVFVPSRTPEQVRIFPALMRVHSGDVAPATAHVSVRYRNQWFWIDDHDLQSKAALNFLMLLFSLAETGAPQGAAPIVTVPAR